MPLRDTLSRRDGNLGSELVARLPEPMLAEAGPLPEGPGWRFELKLDGFRALVSTTGGLRVRSRRGWDMTSLVPELADLPPRLTLDGEIVAFGDDKLPSSRAYASGCFTDALASVSPT